MASPTLSKKRFKHFDACGSDGTDDKKIMAIYEIIDTDGFRYEIRIPKSTKSVDITTKLQTELNKIDIKVDHLK